MLTDSYPICNDTRLCFAQVGEVVCRCKVLTDTYKNGSCPFCKVVQTITDGKIYPYSPATYGRDPRKTEVSH